MDKQKAIDLLDNLLGMVEDNHGSDYDKAIHMGIDALKMQLSIESTTFPVDGEPLDCISRQQAILCIERNAYRRDDINETEYIIKWVLDIIKWLPSVQPEHLVKESGNLVKGLVNDCISRKAALQAMDTWDKFGCDPDGKLVRYDDDKHYVPYVHYEDMVHAVKNLPSQPEHTETHSCENKHTETHDSRREWYMKGYRDGQQRMRGRWIEPTEDNDYWECPVCHDTYELDVDVTPQDARMFFCPNCGADMRGTE